MQNDYDKALPAYYELKNLNFSGKSVYGYDTKQRAEDSFKTVAER
jgi:hypothetical protein